MKTFLVTAVKIDLIVSAGFLVNALVHFWRIEHRYPEMGQQRRVRSNGGARVA